MDVVAKISAVLLAFGGLLAKIFDSASRRDTKSSILKEIEILNALPNDSKSKDELVKHIDQRVKALVNGETLKTRNWSGVAIGVLFLAGGAWSLVPVFHGGTWWVILVAIFLLIGGVGVGINVGKTFRDEKGNKIKEMGIG